MSDPNLSTNTTMEAAFSSMSNHTDFRPLEIRVITNFESVSSLHDEWNTLVEESVSTIYQTYEWLSTWWEHFGKQKGRELHLLLLYHEHRLVGIAPLFIQTTFVFRRPAYKCCCLLGSGDAFNRSFGMFLDDGPTDYLDFIVHPEYRLAVANHLSEYFRTHPILYDEIELLNLPEKSFAHTTFLPALTATGFSCNITEADECPRLTLNSSVDEFVKSLDASVRRRLHQAMKAADEKALFSLLPPTSRADVIATLDELMILHQRRWRKMGYPGLFSKREFSDFQFAITRAFLPNGWIYIKRAVADHRTVAARFCFVFNGRFYDYLSGFDDGAPAAKRRPGLALLLAMMQEMFDMGVHEIDFLRGDEPYKFELTSTSDRNYNAVVFLPAHKERSEQFILNMARVSSFVIYLLEREWNLLKVQYLEHTILKFLYYYLKFRTGRFFNKFFGKSSAVPKKNKLKQQ